MCHVFTLHNTRWASRAGVGLFFCPAEIAQADRQRLVQYPDGFTLSRGEMKISVKSFSLGVAICGEALSEQLSLARQLMCWPYRALFGSLAFSGHFTPGTIVPKPWVEQHFPKVVDVTGVLMRPIQV
jgi:hypothetical protein